MNDTDRIRTVRNNGPRRGLRYDCVLCLGIEANQLGGGKDQPERNRDSATLYARPRYSTDANFFADLVAFAPGLNTTQADMRAVLEAEASLKNNKSGGIDDAARALFEKARLAGTHTLTIPADGLQPAFTIRLNDTGRFEYERTLPIGLREQVICDGKTLLHLYPDLGLAARRSVSRFHRLEFASVVPQALPSPDDYARGADLRVVDTRTVAVVPHGAAEARDGDGKPIPYVELHLVFSDKGPLAERRYVEMPAKKTIAVEQFNDNGAVKYLNADGKVTALRKSELDTTKTEPLKVDLKQFVVLPLPYRTPEHVVKTLGIEKKSYGDLKFEEGNALLSAFFASGNADQAAKVFQQCFHEREQRQLGYYVLLAACGNNLDGDHFDLLTEHPNEPLAQYLALHSSPVLRKHATQWAVASNPWGDGWLNRLATAHALYQRWDAARPTHRNEAQQQTERDRALEYVKHNKGSALAWALLGLVQDRVAADDDGKKDQRAAWKALAEAWLWFAEQPGSAYHARYENARCLWKAGEQDAARKQFRALYEETFALKTLPPLDADFRQAMLGSGEQANEWKDLMRKTARQLLDRKEQTSLLALAAQCWQVGDPVLANDLLEEMLGNVRTDKDYLPLVQAVVEVLLNNGQLEQADQKVQALLRDKALEQQPALHRLAMRIAEMRDQPVRQMRHLERALDLEFQNRPDEMDLSRTGSATSMAHCCGTISNRRRCWKRCRMRRRRTSTGAWCGRRIVGGRSILRRRNPANWRPGFCACTTTAIRRGTIRRRRWRSGPTRRNRGTTWPRRWPGRAISNWPTAPTKRRLRLSRPTRKSCGTACRTCRASLGKAEKVQTACCENSPTRNGNRASPGFSNRRSRSWKNADTDALSVLSPARESHSSEWLSLAGLCRHVIDYCAGNATLCRTALLSRSVEAVPGLHGMALMPCCFSAFFFHLVWSKIHGGSPAAPSRRCHAGFRQSVEGGAGTLFPGFPDALLPAHPRRHRLVARPHVSGQGVAAVAAEGRAWSAVRR